uniref:NADH-ubiquinone oxidoreductase chain 6 n=1 Tax=Neotriplax arisana TaxID=2866210 RepID=A0A8F9RRT8_9CUCU|nr:NADH dehydrogenase subunit 6 [Neotriplax arisana]
MVLIMSSMMMILSCIFLFLSHPLSFGGILFLQTLLVSLTTGLFTFNFWYSYILFLIMVGGMLILFLYMTSIASNEKFKFSMKLFLLLIFMTMTMSMLFFFMKNFFMSFNFNMDSINQNNHNYMQLNMNKYMNYPNSLIFFMMIIYLFISLIAVVKITGLNEGSLRQKF